MARRFANRSAVITGAAAGIGLAIARSFGREGAKLGLIDRDAAGLDRVQAALRGEGVDVVACCADVADPDAVAAAFDRIVEHAGGVLHALVNNAGIAEFAAVEETPLKLWQRTLAVNVTGTFLCSRAAIPRMKLAGGAIVNMASIAGTVGIPRMAAYCASKGAVIALTRQMAVDYAAAGIRVNCLCPGRIAGTELDRQIRDIDSDDVTAAKMACYPLGRFGTPEEIAAAALFLASDEASFVTGTAFCIDGGMTAL